MNDVSISEDFIGPDKLKSDLQCHKVKEFIVFSCLHLSCSGIHEPVRANTACVRYVCLSQVQAGVRGPLGPERLW